MSSATMKSVTAALRNVRQRERGRERERERERESGAEHFDDEQRDRRAAPGLCV